MSGGTVENLRNRADRELSERAMRLKDLLEEIRRTEVARTEQLAPLLTTVARAMADLSDEVMEALMETRRTLAQSRQELEEAKKLLAASNANLESQVRQIEEMLKTPRATRLVQQDREMLSDLLTEIRKSPWRRLFTK